MSTLKKLVAIVIVIAATAISARAERAVIRGTLTIISNQFVVKTLEPVETENEFADNGEIISSKKIQIICTDEQASEIRALVGKKVQMAGELFAAHTLYHIEPLLLDIQDEGDYGEIVPEE